MLSKGRRVSLGGDDHVLKLTVGIIAQLCEYIKSH